MAATAAATPVAGARSAESQPATATTTAAVVSSPTRERHGKADVAIFRPSTGAGQILTSKARLSSTPIVWGIATDVPVPGDYDGDGKTAPAFYSPVTRSWRVLKSDSGFVSDATIALGSA